MRHPGAACPLSRLLLAAAMLVLPGSARAAALGTIGGFDVRLDTTVGLSLGLRTEAANPALLSDVNADDGDRAFAPGPISERLDVAAQLDVSRGDLGLDLGADGWYDAAYQGRDADRSAATFNPVSVDVGRFPAASRTLMGQTIELGTAYVHDKLDIAGTPVSLSIGRQTLLWGESLFFAEDGISAGQAPVDLIKSVSQPLSEARTLFLPVTQAVVRVALPGSLSLEAYDQFEWRNDRIPAVASYFSTTDILDAGGERVFTAGGGSLLRGRDQTPSGAGQFGAALRRDTATLDLGLYALRYDAKYPEVQQTSSNTYRLTYPKGISLFGASASTTLGDDTIAGEISARRQLPLVSRLLPLVPAPGTASGAGVASGYATGDALQALVSLQRQLPPGRFWGTANLQAELVATDLLAVDSGSADRLPGTTSGAVAVQAVFSPTYYRVARDLVLTLPLGLEIGLAGKSNIDAGRDAGTGNLTVGATATYRAVWQLSALFTHFIGPASLQPLADRDFVVLSAARTF